MNDDSFMPTQVYKCQKCMHCFEMRCEHDSMLFCPACTIEYLCDKKEYACAICLKQQAAASTRAAVVAQVVSTPKALVAADAISDISTDSSIDSSPARAASAVLSSIESSSPAPSPKKRTLPLEQRVVYTMEERLAWEAKANRVHAMLDFDDLTEFAKKIEQRSTRGAIQRMGLPGLPHRAPLDEAPRKKHKVVRLSAVSMSSNLSSSSARSTNL